MIAISQELAAEKIRSLLRIFEQREVLAEAFALGVQPEEDMGVEQNLHCPNEASRLVRERSVEVLRHDEASFVDPEPPGGLAWRRAKAGDGLAAASDHDLLAGGHVLDQP